MRIALFHAVPPSGALRAVRELAVRLAKDHRVTVFTIDLGSADRYPHRGTGTSSLEIGADVRCRTLAGRHTRLTSLPEPFASIATIEAVRALEQEMALDMGPTDFDVAFVHPCVYTQSPPLLQQLRIPSLYYVAEPRRRWYEGPTEPVWQGDRPRGMARFDRTRKPYDWINARRDRRAAGAATALVCNSYYTAEAIERAYQRPASVCYLGVDTSVFVPESDRPPATHSRSILSVGAIEAIKGQDTVVEALGLLPEPTRPALDLVFERVHAPYLDYVSRRARELSVEVRLHREVPDTELAVLYSRADVTVCASRLEPFGLTPLESMACGTPVVAVAQGGFRETVVDGVNGFLVDRDSAGVSHGIARILAGELGADAADLRTGVVDLWNWDRAAARIEGKLAALI